MFPTRQGSFRLFRLLGVEVYLHWYWFLWAALRISDHDHGYSSHLWNAIEYLILFGFVLLHEFGHALASKSVGGKSDLIVLWPFGGVAYVNVPPRPGANLWSIAAGPLVNVVLVPVLFFVHRLAVHSGGSADVRLLTYWLQWLNGGMLIFNLLPIYPLDGGQILRSLLWFVCGRAKSLWLTSIIGFVGVGAFVLFAVLHEWWLGAGILSFIALPRCVGAWREAKRLRELESAPRYAGFACPSCHAAPVAGNFWACAHCRTAFDTFLTRAACPNCQATYATTSCPECGQAHPFNDWLTQPPHGGAA
ncbi:MAG: hypothetical protein RLZZ350_1555 [Verrucomicrobiota bacterium]|jgi:Zn-dependent protease